MLVFHWKALWCTVYNSILFLIYHDCWNWIDRQYNFKAIQFLLFDHLWVWGKYVITIRLDPIKNILYTLIIRESWIYNFYVKNFLKFRFFCLCFLLDCRKEHWNSFRFIITNEVTGVPFSHNIFSLGFYRFFLHKTWSYSFYCTNTKDIFIKMLTPVFLLENDGHSHNNDWSLWGFLFNSTGVVRLPTYCMMTWYLGYWLSIIIGLISWFSVCNINGPEFT